MDALPGGYTRHQNQRGVGAEKKSGPQIVISLVMMSIPPVHNLFERFVLLLKWHDDGGR